MQVPTQRVAGDTVFGFRVQDFAGEVGMVDNGKGGEEMSGGIVVKGRGAEGSVQFFCERGFVKGEPMVYRVSAARRGTQCQL